MKWLGVVQSVIKGNRQFGLMLIALCGLLLWGGVFQAAHATVIYVNNTHPAAGDGQPGTQTQPLASINAALQRAWPGDTVLVGPGTYRERLVFVRGGASAETPLTLKAQTPHTVRIMGSEVLTHWTPVFDQIWVRHNWPDASRQVFQNGRPLMSAGSVVSGIDRMIISPSAGGLHAMFSGSFWIDTVLGALYVWLPDGSSPQQHLMEAAVHPHLIAATDLDYIHLEGLVFAHSSAASADAESAMVTVRGRNWRIHNCRFEYAEAGALSLIGDGHVLKNNVFLWSGTYGIQIQSENAATDGQLFNTPFDASLPMARILLEGNETSYGNTIRVGLQEMSGAVQAENYCGQLLISRHLALSNSGVGLRIGTGCREVVVQQSLFRRNSAGLVAAGGQRLAVTNSIFADNTLAMSVFGAGDARVQFNTFHQNVYGLLLGDEGADTSPTESRPGRAPAAYNLFNRNIDLDLGLWALHVRNVFPLADANVYARPDATAAYQWMDSDGQLRRATQLMEVQNATGQEQHSRTIVPLWETSTRSPDFIPPPTFPLIPAISQDDALETVDFYGSPRQPRELAAGAVMPETDGRQNQLRARSTRRADADASVPVPGLAAPGAPAAYDPSTDLARAAAVMTASYAPDLQPGGFFQAESDTPAPHLAWWAAAPFADAQGTLWVGVDGTGPDAIHSVQFAIDGAWQPPVTTPHYHADRDLTAWWLAVAPTAPANDLTVQARVIFGGGAARLHSNRLTIGHNRQGWDVLTFTDGWTVLPPAPDSRLIYMAADGDDTQAEAVYGRGWYYPHDPEIGPDPTHPVGPVIAYASVAAAAQKLRLTNWIGVQDGVDQYGDRAAYQHHQDTLGHGWLGYPDWLLYRRGDDFHEQPQPDTEELRPRTQGLRQRGRAANMPMVITAWGDPAAPRPLVSTWEMWGHARHFRLVSLDVTGQVHWKPGAQSQQHNAWWAEDILLEDVRARGLGATNHSAWNGVLVRRSVVVDQWDANRHNQGIYISNMGRAGQPLDQGPPGQVWPEDRWRFEGTLFDRNGYKQDPNEPATWTRDVNGSDDLSPGRGVQPRRTWYDRNIYAATYDQLHLVNNLFSRNGGGGSVQMRTGGIADNNLFMWNESALSTSHAQTDRQHTRNAVIRSNVVLHDDHWLPPGGFGQGLYLGVGPKRTGVMIGNIVTHLHRGNNGGAALAAGGIPGYRRPEQEGFLPPEQAGHVTVMRNLGFTRQTDNLLIHGPSERDGILAGQIGGNILVNLDSRRVARFNQPSLPPEVQFGVGTTAGNHYLAGGSAGFAVGSDQIVDFEQWQATGLDHHSLLYADLASMADALNWLPPNSESGEMAGWERDIVFCMQTIDPAYTPNEDVYVDAGASGAKQTERQKVWEVLTRFEGYPHDGGTRPRMSEADAQTVARRYHAFLSFMERARENRKHQWNTQYTAAALNACIREGFRENWF